MRRYPVQQTVELVTLLDDHGRPCGSAPKADVHHGATPLHLAFSCWILDDAGRTLLTRRALTKRTWPGVWTNTFCGHPAPGEPVEDAVHRRAADELGVRVAGLRPVLPDFRYRAVMDDGTVENEVCPVYAAQLDGVPAPNPDEVQDLRWVALDVLASELVEPGTVFSPWLRMQWEAIGEGASLRSPGVTP